MKLYQLVDDGNGHWKGTRSEAQRLGKELATPTFRGALRLHEVNVETDKAGVLAIMNGDPKFTVLRTWKLTSRGGLEELK